MRACPGPDKSEPTQPTTEDTSMEITHNGKTLLCAAALLAVAAAGGNLAQAQSCTATWTGNAGNGSWSTAGNWSPRKVPGTTSDVCIPLFTQADGAGLDGSTKSISVHSIQIAEGGSLILGSGKVSIATSLINDGGLFLYGTTVTAASIDMPNPGQISVYGNSVITSPEFSNPTGLVYVGAGFTLKLTDNPVQLVNGNLSGGNWETQAGTLILPSDITQITTQQGAAYGTTVSLDGTGSAIEDASGNDALATLTSVGPSSVLGLFTSASLTIDQGLTIQGVVDASGTLRVNGTYTLESGGSTGIGGSLTATSVNVESGSSLGGSGSVVSSIMNSGTVTPGVLTVTGNYTQTAGGALTEVFGSTLHVNSNATLSGALNVTINPKRPPKSGQMYTALTFGSLSGSFTSHTTGYTLATNANNITVTKQ
jgi:hypothetical protein